VKALILAAGYATRLYPLTKDMPKALLPIGGRAMLDYLMDGIVSIPEIDGCVIVTNHRFAEQFRAWANCRSGIPIEVVDDMTTNNDNRLGAIGDISYAIDRANIDDDVLVAASDNFFTFNLNDYAEAFRQHGRDTLLAGKIDSIEDLRRFAVAVLDENGRVVNLVEKPQDPPSDIAVYALYIYRRDTIPMIKQYLAEGNNPDAPGHFPEWLYKRRDVRAYVFEGECVDIGTVASYNDICEKYSNK